MTERQGELHTFKAEHVERAGRHQIRAVRRKKVVSVKRVSSAIAGVERFSMCA